MPKYSNETSSQAPSYASPKLRPSHLLTYLLTGVKCRATSVAKNSDGNVIKFYSFSIGIFPRIQIVSRTLNGSMYCVIRTVFNAFVVVGNPQSNEYLYRSSQRYPL